MALAGGELVGFVYGCAVPSTTRRWDGFLTSPPGDMTVEWEGRTFAVIDFAVDERWRGRGIGRQLLDTLLASRREERATLSVEPAAEETQAFYRHLGWRHIGRKRASEGFLIPLFDVYLLPLRGQQSP